MRSVVCIAAMAFGSLILTASGDEVRALPEEERNAVKLFFDEFKEAFNTRNTEQVQILSGTSAKRWLRWMNGKEKIGEINIVDCVVDVSTNVTAKVSVNGGDKGHYAFDAVFTMKKTRGLYSIEAMALPEADRLNEEFDKAVDVGKRLIAAINGKDMAAVKATTSFSGCADFDAELSSRGLSWIKDSIDSGVEIREKGMKVMREGMNTLVGCVEIPCASGCSNVLMKVVFKDMKIDCAAPREETEAERLLKFEELKRIARRGWENERRKADDERKRTLQRQSPSK